VSSGAVILLTAMSCAAACSLLGSFLILRRMAMMTDAISHAILPGLVFGFWIANGSNLIVGAVGATIAALLTVTLVEALGRTRRVDGGSAMGIVFPAMFALGTVLVSRYFSDVHLDSDAILMGNIEFSVFDRFTLSGYDLGPRSLWIMGALIAINAGFLILFFKELKLTTFDPALAAAMGFVPVVLNYVFMAVLSVTTVGAFTAVGAILVVALVIVPSATAYLLTDRLGWMIGLSVTIGAFAAWIGFQFALWQDVSVSGSMAAATGFLFLLALLFSPSQGVVARFRQTRRNRQRFAIDLLLVHLLTHESQRANTSESTLGHVSAALRWSPPQASAAIGRALNRGLIHQTADQLTLTPSGRVTAELLGTR